MTTLHKESSGVYVTEDGRYEISKGTGYGWCDDPHPVPIPKEVRFDLRERIRAGESKPADVDQQVWQAVLDGKKGWYCEGGEEHPYDSWGAWDRQGDDYIDGGEDFRTKKEAVAFLDRHLDNAA